VLLIGPEIVEWFTHCSGRLVEKINHTINPQKQTITMKNKVINTLETGSVNVL
jgi:hypothetical protein